MKNLFDEPFDMTQDSAETSEVQKTPDDISALDEMFHGSLRYRHSADYMRLLNFVSRFRHYAPFNGMLLHIQNPDAVYVASISDWKRRFDRRPTRHARPLVILQPFGPVMFLYDIADTEGADVPEEALEPFKTDGYLPGHILATTIHNCALHHIEVKKDLSGIHRAGRAIRLTPEARQEFKDLKLSAASEYLILLNTTHEIEEQYSSLVHELAHIFCGHLGTDALAWWESNTNLSTSIEEIEAESVAYLVCRRQGLTTTSERYLSNYLKQNVDVPEFGLNAVLQATDYIEKMGQSAWKKPLRKSKHALKT